MLGSSGSSGSQSAKASSPSVSRGSCRCSEASCHSCCSSGGCCARDALLAGCAGSGGSLGSSSIITLMPGERGCKRERDYNVPISRLIVVQPHTSIWIPGKPRESQRRRAQAKSALSVALSVCCAPARPHAACSTNQTGGARNKAHSCLWELCGGPAAWQCPGIRLCSRRQSELCGTAFSPWPRG